MVATADNDTTAESTTALAAALAAEAATLAALALATLALATEAATTLATEAHRSNDQVTDGIDASNLTFFGLRFRGDLQYFILDDIRQVVFSKHKS